jgi:hypothetical protein
MRMKLKESKVGNLILPRRGFLVGLASLLAAPAVVRAEALMPIKVWRPPINLFLSGYYGIEMVALNGAELKVADFPDLFDQLGYKYGGSGGHFRLPDESGKARLPNRIDVDPSISVRKLFAPLGTNQRGRLKPFKMFFSGEFDRATGRAYESPPFTPPAPLEGTSDVEREKARIEKQRLEHREAARVYEQVTGRPYRPFSVLTDFYERR